MRAERKMMDRHVNVGGEDRQQQRREPERRGPSQARDQQPKAARYFEEAAEDDQLKVPRQVGRHDPDVGFGIDEMKRSRAREAQREEPTDGVFQPS